MQQNVIDVCDIWGGSVFTRMSSQHEIMFRATVGAIELVHLFLQWRGRLLH